MPRSRLTYNKIIQDQAGEIASLKINANLVVLSACNTGAGGGKGFGGGALQGLADAFFNAGAHAVLASHWEVPSAATMALMTGAFSNMAADPKARVKGECITRGTNTPATNPLPVEPMNDCMDEAMPRRSGTRSSSSKVTAGAESDQPKK